MTGRDPAEALRAVINQICSNNRKELFGTERMFTVLNEKPILTRRTYKSKYGALWTVSWRVRSSSTI